MTDPKHPLSKQPYHEAEDLPLARAASLLDRHSRVARSMAARALTDVTGELRRRGYRPIGCGLLLASGRPLPRLEAVLASHALIHTADGEHFRNAVADASEGCGLAVTRIRERELAERAEAALRSPAPQLQASVASLGRGLGPPWTQDQKLATLVAWIVLAGRHAGQSYSRRGGIPDGNRA